MKATVKEVLPVNSHVSLIRLAKPAGFSFVPGQWISVWCDDFFVNGKPLRRAFSIASLPEEDYIELCIAKGRHLSVHLQSLSPGSEINIEGPFGLFQLKDSLKSMFIAGGTGIAPFRPMIHQALKQGREVMLIFSMRSREGFIYEKELTDLSEKPNFTLVPTLTRCHDIHNWKGCYGRVDTFLEMHWKKGFDCYLCGPPGFVSSVGEKLEELGQDMKKVYAEKWQ